MQSTLKRASGQDDDPFAIVRRIFHLSGSHDQRTHGRRGAGARGDTSIAHIAPWDLDAAKEITVVNRPYGTPYGSRNAPYDPFLAKLIEQRRVAHGSAPVEGKNFATMEKDRRHTVGYLRFEHGEDQQERFKAGGKNLPTYNLDLAPGLPPASGWAVHYGPGTASFFEELMVKQNKIHNMKVLVPYGPAPKIVEASSLAGDMQRSYAAWSARVNKDQPGWETRQAAVDNLHIDLGRYAAWQGFDAVRFPASGPVPTRDVWVTRADIVTYRRAPRNPRNWAQLSTTITAAEEPPETEDYPDLFHRVFHMLGRHDQRTHGRRGPGQKPREHRALSAELWARIRAEGGFTYEPIGRGYPTKGFAVSAFPEEGDVRPGRISPTRVRMYVAKHMEFVRSQGGRGHFGAWYDEATKKTYLDISLVVGTHEEAQRLCREHKQLAYFDLETFDTYNADGSKRASEPGPGDLHVEGYVKAKAFKPKCPVCGRERCEEHPEALAASDPLAFHLPGQHDQQHHSRGGLGAPRVSVSRNTPTRRPNDPTSDNAGGSAFRPKGNLALGKGRKLPLLPFGKRQGSPGPAIVKMDTMAADLPDTPNGRRAKGLYTRFREFHYAHPIVATYLTSKAIQLLTAAAIVGLDMALYPGMPSTGVLATEALSFADARRAQRKGRLSQEEFDRLCEEFEKALARAEKEAKESMAKEKQASEELGARIEPVRAALPEGFVLEQLYPDAAIASSEEGLFMFTYEETEAGVQLSEPHPVEVAYVARTEPEEEPPEGVVEYFSDGLVIEDEEEEGSRQATEEAHDLWDLTKADGGTERFFMELHEFAEPPEWIPFLPKTGKHKHPKWGDIVISPERVDRFVENFNSGIYQTMVPLDAEHMTKLSGAAAWIKQLRKNEDGTVDARVDWTDRGRAFLEGDRFRYISPEWYDSWTDPATGRSYKDVIVGGALTTRPFFKEGALRPLVASERGWSSPGDEAREAAKDGEGGREEEHPKGGNTVELTEEQAKAFSEMTARMGALETENSELKKMTELQATELRSATEALKAMRVESRRARYTDIVLGRGEEAGPRWFGEPKKHVAMLERFADAFGEDSTEVKDYIETNQQYAEQLKASGLFKEQGVTSNKPAGSAGDVLRERATAIATSEKISFGDAMTRVMSESPELYDEYRRTVAVKA